MIFSTWTDYLEPSITRTTGDEPTSFSTKVSYRLFAYIYLFCTKSVYLNLKTSMYMLAINIALILSVTDSLTREAERWHVNIINGYSIQIQG